MLLFFLFRDEKKLLSGSPPLYQSKLQQQGAQGVINRNKIKFEPCDDLIDQAFRISSILNIMPQILPDDEIAKGANFLIQSKGKYSIG